MRQATAARIAQHAYQAAGIRADAALTNEHLTRQRVERLENILGRNLWGRLRWLLTGK